MRSIEGMKACAAAVALALALGGCGTVSRDVAADGSGAGTLVFPDPGDATMKGGTFVNVHNLRQVAPGLDKAQLYDLLGPPHFHEGLWGVREWDYLFDFRVGDGSKVVTCQFKALFDRDSIARSFYWKPAECEQLVHPKPAPPPAPPPPPRLDQPIRLSSDALFGFDRAKLEPAGRDKLDALVGQIREASRVQAIRVVGYTDRIGADAYNMKLSQRRARSVVDYLVAAGVPADRIHAEGRGEADPLVQCEGRSGRALITCLAPNRRVEISGEAVR